MDKVCKCCGEKMDCIVNEDEPLLLLYKCLKCSNVEYESLNRYEG